MPSLPPYRDASLHIFIVAPRGPPSVGLGPWPRAPSWGCGFSSSLLRMRALWAFLSLPLVIRSRFAPSLSLRVFILNYIYATDSLASFPGGRAWSCYHVRTSQCGSDVEQLFACCRRVSLRGFPLGRFEALPLLSSLPLSSPSCLLFRHALRLLLLTLPCGSLLRIVFFSVSLSWLPFVCGAFNCSVTLVDSREFQIGAYTDRGCRYSAQPTASPSPP